MARLTAGALCALVAACSYSPTSDNSPRAEENRASMARANEAPRKSAEVPDDPGISITMAALFDLPESTLRTECSAAGSYADRRVHPAFYSTPRPPEFERYAQCLLAEARRDGGPVRLASASSFPRVGTCYSTSITIRARDYSSADFDNGLSLTDYGYVPWVAHSRVGDPVRACVERLPEGCPAYDLRGIAYRVRNLRTGTSWVGADYRHLCRGA